jgi:hypothetical protein
MMLRIIAWAIALAVLSGCALIADGNQDHPFGAKVFFADKERWRY